MSPSMSSHGKPLRHRRRAALGLELLETRTLLAADVAGGIVLEQLLDAVAQIEIQTTIVSADNPANHVVPAGSPFDGVGRVEVRTTAGVVLGFASGTLIAGGAYVLTAAHVVADAGQAIIAWPNAGIGPVTSSEFFVHDLWDGNPLASNDVALIKLPTPVTAAPSYELQRGTAEVGKVATIVGYGLSGSGQNGAVNGTYGTLRKVENRLDDTYTPDASQPAGQHPMLAFDFDSGKFQHDTIGLFFGIRDRGLGSAREGMISPGDSGGATFLNVDGQWQVAGVNSFLMSFGFIFDSSPGVNASFGELGFVTRVSAFDEWIDGQISAAATSSAGSTAAAPPPGATPSAAPRRVRLDAGGRFIIIVGDLTAPPFTEAFAPFRTPVTFVNVPTFFSLPPLPAPLLNQRVETPTLVAGQVLFLEETEAQADPVMSALDAFWRVFGGLRRGETPPEAPSTLRAPETPPSREQQEQPPDMPPEEDVSLLELDVSENCELFPHHAYDGAPYVDPAMALAALALAVGSWREERIVDDRLRKRRLRNNRS